jgi:hypothetical protein
MTDPAWASRIRALTPLVFVATTGRAAASDSRADIE